MSHPNDMIRPWCVVCGHRATNLHHEPPKGLGGVGRKGTEPARLSLCGSGTTGCHGERHAGILGFKFEDCAWWWQRNHGEWKPCMDEFDWWWNA